MCGVTRAAPEQENVIIMEKLSQQVHTRTLKRTFSLIHTHTNIHTHTHTHTHNTNIHAHTLTHTHAHTHTFL